MQHAYGGGGLEHGEEGKLLPDGLLTPRSHNPYIVEAILYKIPLEDAPQTVWSHCHLTHRDPSLWPAVASPAAAGTPEHRRCWFPRLGAQLTWPPPVGKNCRGKPFLTGNEWMGEPN